MRAFYGNFGVLVRALAYILANGPDGLRQTTEDAVLNANYIRKKLEGVYDLPYTTPTHARSRLQRRAAGEARACKTGDIAKRLIDYGFHPYTVSFPLIVHGALMIEPTESEVASEELDLFIDAMKSIAQEVEEDPQTRAERAAHHARLASGRSRRRAQAGPALEAANHLIAGRDGGICSSLPRFPCAIVW